MSTHEERIVQSAKLIEDTAWYARTAFDFNERAREALQSTHRELDAAYKVLERARELLTNSNSTFPE